MCIHVCAYIQLIVSHSAKTIWGADHADDIVPLANILTQAESLQHSLRQAAGGIGIYVNVEITKSMCFEVTSPL